MLDVHRLRLLRELAHRGTIAAVAEALSYTPSAVSQQLATLEREAGVSLLERTGRRVRLTPAGRSLVGHAEQVLAELERAEATLAASTGMRGRLRIGAVPSAARSLLPPVLVALGREHPGLELAVEEIDPLAAAEAVRTGDLDVALTQQYDLVPAPDSPALESVMVLSEPMYLATERPVAPADDPVRGLRADPWILGKPGTLCRTAAERICQTAGFEPRVRHQTDDFPTALALVAAGQGHALLPALGTVDCPAGVVLTELPQTSRVMLVNRSGAGAHPATTAFREAVENSIASRDTMSRS